MSTTQKIIKYLAIAFAIFLIYNIMSAIVFGISSITNILEKDNYQNEEQLKDIDLTNDINILNINISASKLTIKTGDTLKAETNNENINITKEDNQLYIEEKEHRWFTKTNQEIIIYIPTNLELDIVYISTGAGNIYIEELIAKTIHLNLGAGSTEINKLNALNNIKIESGLGDVKILDGTLKNLNLNTGIGSIKLNARIEGQSKITSGIGDIELNLIGSLDDYTFELSKGIGDATLNSKTIEDEKTYGSGENIIEIDGGIGNIEINVN